MIISKKLAYKLFIVFAVAHFPIINMALAQERSAVQIETNNIRNSIEMPQDSVLNAIKKNCRNCKLVTLNDLVDEAREEFLELYPNANPGWITGDFNGDGLSDYAVLLYNKEKEKIYIRLLALLANNEGTFRINTLVRSFHGGFYWYIGLMESGSIIKHTKAFAPPKNVPKEILLKYPAIRYYKEGSSMTVFYFETAKGIFIEIPVSY